MLSFRSWTVGVSLLVSLSTCAPAIEPACTGPTGVPGETIPTMMSVRHPDVQLATQQSGTIRTYVKGVFTAGSRSMRFFSTEQFSPPYVWTGSYKVNNRLPNPLIRSDGTAVTYDHALVFHPATMPDQPGSSNWNNLLLSMYPEPNLVGGVGGISAELHVPGSPRGSVYGVRSGYVSRVRTPYPAMDGKWHDFRIEVDSTAAYRLIVDGVTLLDVVERAPTSMFGDRFAVGLRLDGFDIEFDDLRVVEK